MESFFLLGNEVWVHFQVVFKQIKLKWIDILDCMDSKDKKCNNHFSQYLANSYVNSNLAYW